MHICGNGISGIDTHTHPAHTTDTKIKQTKDEHFDICQKLLLLVVQASSNMYGRFMAVSH